MLSLNVVKDNWKCHQNIIIPDRTRSCLENKRQNDFQNEK